MLLQMSGLPVLLTFTWYSDIYPIEVEMPNVHHFLSLSLTLILLTVGPNKLNKWYFDPLAAKIKKAMPTMKKKKKKVKYY